MAAACILAAFAIGGIVLSQHNDEGTPAAATSASTAASADVAATAASDAAAAASAASVEASEAATSAQSVDPTSVSALSVQRPPQIEIEKPAPPAAVDQRTAVLSDTDTQVLDGLVDKIAQIKLEIVVVTGYTDASGSSAAYNDRLSLRRAQAVKIYLVSKGVEANRIYTEGKGSRNPVGPQDTPDGRRMNNRAEIEVVGTNGDSSGQKITYQEDVHF